MSGDDEVTDDPVTRTALQLLPIPEHAPDFWSLLDGALSAPVAVAEPERPIRRDERRLVVTAPGSPPRGAAPARVTPDPSLALVPPALRRRSNVALAVVAVAAAVVAVVAGATLVRQRSGEGFDLAELTATDEALVSTSSPETPSAGGPSTEAVAAWVALVADQDTEGAWSALGPASRAQLGSHAAFAADWDALAARYGAWGGVAPDEVIVTRLAEGADGEWLVVTMVGTVSQDGRPQVRSEAIPVHVVDGSARVEPFAFAGELELVVPEPRADGTKPAVRVDDALVVVVPRGVETPTLRLDGATALVCGEAPDTALTELADAPGQRCSYTPDGGIPAGTHVLTVAFVAPDGTGAVARSILFKVA